jgi:hypothetical protein
LKVYRGSCGMFLCIVPSILKDSLIVRFVVGESPATLSTFEQAQQRSTTRKLRQGIKWRTPGWLRQSQLLRILLRMFETQGPMSNSMLDDSLCNVSIASGGVYAMLARKRLRVQPRRPTAIMIVPQVKEFPNSQQ